MTGTNHFKKKTLAVDEVLMTWHERAILKLVRRVVGYNYTPPYLHSLHTRKWNTWIIHVLTRHVTPRPFADI